MHKSFIQLLIASDGEVLRAQMQASSGITAIDSVALKIVQQTRWQPAQYKGKPFKTDVVVPLRIWDNVRRRVILKIGTSYVRTLCFSER